MNECTHECVHDRMTERITYFCIVCMHNLLTEWTNECMKGETCVDIWAGCHDESQTRLKSHKAKAHLARLALQHHREPPGERV